MRLALPALLSAVVACTLALTAHAASPLAPGFQNLPYGFHYTGVPLQLVSGDVPQWISGTLYRNGPGMYPNVTRPHWFDGYAFLHAYHFAAGSVTADANFVYSLNYNLSRPAHDGDDGGDERVQEARRDPVPAASAQPEFAPSYLDTSAAGVGNASWFPYSPNTAVTLQSIGGVLMTSTATLNSNSVSPSDLTNLADPYEWPDDLPFLPSPEHRRQDPRTGVWYHFAYDVLPVGYLFYTLEPNTTSRKALSLLPMVDSLNYQHSYSLTENYIVLSDIPVPLPISFKWTDFRVNMSSATYWRVVSKATGAEVARFTSPPMFMFHHIHAYEEASTNEIVVDLIAYPDASSMSLLFLDQILSNSTAVMECMAQGAPTRFVLPMDRPNATVQGRVIAQTPMELPVVNAAAVGLGAYRFVYATSLSSPATALFFDQLVKLDVQTGDKWTWSEEGCWPGEPIFVPEPAEVDELRRKRGGGGGGSAAPEQQPAEDAGVLASVVLCNGDPAAQPASFLVLLDAADMSEVARLALPHVMPLGFHGLFLEDQPQRERVEWA